MGGHPLACVRLNAGFTTTRKRGLEKKEEKKSKVETDARRGWTEQLLNAIDRGRSGAWSKPNNAQGSLDMLDSAKDEINIPIALSA